MTQKIEKIVKKDILYDIIIVKKTNQINDRHIIDGIDRQTIALELINDNFHWLITQALYLNLYNYINFYLIFLIKFISITFDSIIYIHYY
jgi:hypothetical protein